MIAGVDFSTNAIDVVMLDLDSNAATWHRRRLDDNPRLDAFARARRVREAMPARAGWKDVGVVAVAFEEPFANSLREARAYGRLEGALLAVLPIELPVFQFPPGTWKLASVGSGRATKAEVAAWAADHWESSAPAFSAMPQDAFDAFAIAWAGRARYLEEAAAA